MFLSMADYDILQDALRRYSGKYPECNENSCEQEKEIHAKSLNIAMKLAEKIEEILKEHYEITGTLESIQYPTG